jgi:hypothetical protein
VEQLQQVAVHVAVQVDQQVAAADQVEPRKRRLLQQVVAGEQHVVAQGLAHLVLLGFAREITLQLQRWDRLGDGGRIQAGARDLDRMLVDVGSEDLPAAAAGRGGGFVNGFAGIGIGQQHGQGVGFFAAGTGGHPGARWRASGRHQSGQNQALQRIEGFAVAVKAGHPDQQVLAQGLHFDGIAAQQLVIAGQVGHPTHLQAPLQAAQQRRPPVMREIMAGALAQHRQHIAQRHVGIRAKVERNAVERMAVRGLAPQQARDVAQFGQLARYLGGGKHEIRHARGDGRTRHAAVLGIAGQLRDGHAAHFLDAGQPGGAVSSHARQHDADRVFAVHLGQGAQEDVGRDRPDPAQPAAVEFVEHQVAVLHAQTAVGRNHIHMVGQDRGGVSDLHHRHRGGALQHPVGRARLVGGQVQDYHQRHAGVGLHVFQQRHQGLVTAGRGADTDHRKRHAAGRRRWRRVLVSHCHGYAKPRRDENETTLTQQT